MKDCRLPKGTPFIIVALSLVSYRTHDGNTGSFGLELPVDEEQRRRALASLRGESDIALVAHPFSIDAFLRGRPPKGGGTCDNWVLQVNPYEGLETVDPERGLADEPGMES